MITSSTHTLGSVQIDGRRWVREDHVDQSGVHHFADYLAAADADYVAIRTERALRLWERLVAQEIEDAMRVDANPALVYATKTDFVPVFRETYRASVREECARLATWILARIVGGWATDTQVRNAFGLTVAQWNALKAKMTTLRDNWAAVQAAAGE